ncbi:MAG: OmpA family protein [Bacteroidota bacterium]
MKKSSLWIFLFVCSLQTSFAQFDIMSGYAGVGYNFSHTALRGINRFVDAYNSTSVHGSGYNLTEPMNYIKGIKGHNIVFGFRLDDNLFEINWTRKYGENIAEFVPYATREIAFKTRTFGLGYFYKISNLDVIRTEVFAGGHMDFIKAKLLTRVKYVDEDLDWTELNIDNGRGNFSMFSPTLKFICTPFDKIPISFAINTYWQMNWKNQDFSSLDDAIPNNWTDFETRDSLKSSGGNVGIVFQILINPSRVKFEKKEKPIKEIVPEITDITIKGNIVDSITRNHINAIISVTKKDNYGIETDVINKLNVAGLYDLKLPKASEYKFKIEAFGYETKEETIKFYDYNSNTIEKDFELNKLRVGQSVKLNNIYFKKASAELLSESFPELDKLYDYLKNNSTVEIEIAGHTSSEGADDYNMNLSKDRAASVRKYILKKGIKDDRITSKGYGETMPVETNETEEGRMLNRRVEFKILKN